MRSFLRVLCAVWMVACGAPAPAAEAYPESAVKAAFLLRFAEYVEWPSAPQGEFVIAVLGRNGMATKLQEFATRPMHGSPVRIRAVDSVAEARGAHMLYVGLGRRSELESLQRRGPLPGLLVVSEAEQGLAQGSTINFLEAEGRVRFEVSLQSARRAGLKVSAELLSVAARVVQ